MGSRGDHPHSAGAAINRHPKTGTNQDIQIGGALKGPGGHLGGPVHRASILQPGLPSRG